MVSGWGRTAKLSRLSIDINSKTPVFHVWNGLSEGYVLLARRIILCLLICVLHTHPVASPAV